jgi:hypothetical protein
VRQSAATVNGPLAHDGSIGRPEPRPDQTSVVGSRGPHGNAGAALS